MNEIDRLQKLAGIVNNTLLSLPKPTLPLLQQQNLTDRAKDSNVIVL